MKTNTKLNSLGKVLNFFQQAEQLKQTLRFSERKDTVRESSADHSWRLSLMVFVTAEELRIDLDKEKALKIAIVHDLAESIVGDVDFRLIVDGKISKEEKKKREKGAMQEIRNSLPNKLGNEIYNLWNDYEKGSTREARFVKALDKLETLSHLLSVGYKAYRNDRPEIIPNYADEAVRDFPELIKLLKLIKQGLKIEFKKCNIPWTKKYESM